MDEKAKAKYDGITNKKTIQKRMQNAASHWLIGKGAQYGFSVETSEDEPWLDAYAYQQHLLRKKGNQNIRFSSIDFSGTLVIIDPIRFKESLYTGIGRAKSFGCGLMLIKPV